VAGAPLWPGDVPRILKALAVRAGIDPAMVSGHSARVGMAQDLVAGGADLPEVMQAGRWKSPAMPAGTRSGCWPGAAPWPATMKSAAAGEVVTAD
jgi:hypothetical protein